MKSKIFVCFLILATVFCLGGLVGASTAPKYEVVQVETEVDNSALIDNGYIDSTYLDTRLDEDSEQELVRRIVELLEHGNVRFEMHLDLNQEEGTTGTMDIFYENHQNTIDIIPWEEYPDKFTFNIEGWD